MKFAYFENKPRAKPKILPAFGGIKKNYIRKSHCLKKILLFLSSKLNEVNESLKQGEKIYNEVETIAEDIRILSKYENENKTNFYFLCQKIISKY